MKFLCCLQAHVICVVYSVEDETTIDKVSSFCKSNDWCTGQASTLLGQSGSPIQFSGYFETECAPKLQVLRMKQVILFRYGATGCRCWDGRCLKRTGDLSSWWETSQTWWRSAAWRWVLRSSSCTFRSEPLSGHRWGFVWNVSRLCVSLLQTILPIMNEYAEVETCVEVSYLAEDETKICDKFSCTRIYHLILRLVMIGTLCNCCTMWPTLYPSRL